MKRLQKELIDISKKPVPGCSTGPLCETDMTRWVACLTGPEGSPYAGGNFTVEIKFSTEYPLKPPKVQFVTKIYHPNINASGNICMGLLHQGWEPTKTVADILLAIRSLLIDPNPDDPLVPEIAMTYKNNKIEYEVIAKEWTVKYAT